MRDSCRTGGWRLKQCQEKWEPVFRPALRLEISRARLP
jgi:hypothetical protein